MARSSAGLPAPSEATRPPVKETLVRELACGDFLEQQRNVGLIGGTRTGRSHLAVAIARACIRSGGRGRFLNAVDLVNKLAPIARDARRISSAASTCSPSVPNAWRRDGSLLDELGYLPFAQTGGQLLFHLISRLYERTSIIVPATLVLGGWPVRHCARTNGASMAQVR